MSKAFITLVIMTIVASALGCADSGDVTTAVPSSPTTQPTPATGETTVPVGVLLPLTGPNAWVSDAIPAIELALDEINAAGGAAGHMIVLRVEDSETEDTAAIAGATTLLDVDEVTALIGPTSLTISAVMPIIQRHGILGISPTAGTTALDTVGGQYIFRTVSSDTVMGTGMVSFAVNELGAEKAALFFADTGSASSISGVLQVAAQVLGLEIVAEVTFPENAPTYRAELFQVAEQAPDVIFFEAGPESSQLFFAQAQEVGITATWIGTDFVNTAFAEKVAQSGEGVIAVNPAPVITERYEAWKTLLEEKRGEPGVPTFSANAYDAMIIIALAMEAAGEPTREGILAQVREVANPPGERVTNFAQGKTLLNQGQDIDYQGIAGAQDFNDFGDVVTSLQVTKLDQGKLGRIATLTQEDIGDALQQVLEAISQP